MSETFSWEFLKLPRSIIFCNILICTAELDYMKDYIKFKFTKKSCKFCKETKAQTNLWELSKEGKAFSKSLLRESVFTKILRYTSAANLSFTTEMQAVNYRSKILQQGDSKTDYLSEIFSEIFKGKFSSQSTTSGSLFFYALQTICLSKTISMFIELNIFHNNLTNKVYEHFCSSKYCMLSRNSSQTFLWG